MTFANIFKGSIAVRGVVSIIKAFVIAYDNSRLKRFASSVGICFKSSKTYNVLHRYANKKPYYKSSITYRFVMAIAGLFDRLFAFINKAGKRLLKGSIIASEIKSLSKSDVNTKLCSLGLLLMSIPIGSIIALLVLRNVPLVSMVICWVVFALGLILVFIGSCDKGVKNSLVINWISKFFDLIR